MWNWCLRTHQNWCFRKKNCFTCGQDADLVLFCQLKEKSELAFFRCLCTCSVNVQTWKLIFMFAFVSTLFSNTANVIEIFLHSCANLTPLKILYDFLGLGQTPWWRLCLSDKLYIRISWFYSSFLMIMRRSWQTSLNIFRIKESFTSSSQIYTRYDMGKCFLRLNFTHVKSTLKSLRRPIQK